MGPEGLFRASSPVSGAQPGPPDVYGPKRICGDRARMKGFELAPRAEPTVMRRLCANPVLVSAAGGSGPACSYSPGCFRKRSRNRASARRNSMRTASSLRPSIFSPAARKLRPWKNTRVIAWR
jgi:hypothetical protein